MRENVPSILAAEPPAEVVRSLASWRRTVVIGHVVPDADCLGGMFALAGAFADGDGRQAFVSLPESSLSKRLDFLWRGSELRLAGDCWRCISTASDMLQEPGLAA